MERLICFDLEGPLSPQDNAYEVMSLIDGGDRIFEVLSRYDDIVTLEKRTGYEPGDTLALIVPFLLLHDICEKDIKQVSDRAKIVDGAFEMIAKLKEEGWHVHIISTSYEQHAKNIGKKLGVSEQNISCTKLDLHSLKKNIKNKLSIVEDVEHDIIRLSQNGEIGDEIGIVKRLDDFFYNELKDTFDVFSNVRVMGGQRKVEAMLKIADMYKKSPGGITVVGDSITDYKMLKKVKEAGGISVVFNGNEYAAPYANIGLASMDMRVLSFITQFEDNKDAFEFVRAWELKRDAFIKNPDKISGASVDIKKLLSGYEEKNFPYLHYLGDNPNIEEVVKTHKMFRIAVRGQAAKIG